MPCNKGIEHIHFSCIIRYSNGRQKRVDILATLLVDHELRGSFIYV